jgi:hypothetical protein
MAVGGKAVDGMAGNEPGRPDPLARQQLEDPARADKPELAPRELGRGVLVAVDPGGDDVEVEAQAGGVGGYDRGPPAA